MKVAIFLDPELIESKYYTALKKWLTRFDLQQVQIHFICLIPSKPGGLLPSLKKKSKQASQKDIEGIVRKLGFNHGQLKMLTVRSPFGRIVGKKAADILNKGGYDLGISLSYSKSQVKKFFLGSFSETVVHFSKKPILIIPPDLLNQKNTKRWLFAHDLTPEGDKSFKKFLKWCQVMGVRPDVVYVAEPWFGNRDIDKASRIKKQMLETKLSSIEKQIKKISQGAGRLYIEYHFSNIATQILKRAKAEKVDWIVIDSHSHGLRQILFSSVTSQILRQKSYPVFLIK